MNRYQNGKVYKIIAPDDTFYVGSTIQSLNERFGGHKYSFKSVKSGKNIRGTAVFELFEKYGVEVCRIELIEEYPCDSKRDLERREGEIIKNTKCINKVVAGRTSEEYRLDNSEKLKNKFKQFYENNKERELERIRQYYIDNTDKVKDRAKEYAKLNKERIAEYKREWRLENKELVNEQKRRWREINKDKINQRKRELRAQKLPNNEGGGDEFS